jgi:peptidoglycan hydrolase-like protein with peptidoglycan-binding domain
MPDHKIKQGECLSSIAHAYGFGDPLTIFNHANNEGLRSKRKSPNCLFPGDVLFVPEKVAKNETGATQKAHHFQVRVPKKKIHVILEDPDDRPLANAAFTLVVGAETIQGKTDAKGALDAMVPNDALEGELTIGRFSWTLQIGHMNPIEHAPDEGLSGVVHRLINLGYSLPKAAKSFEPAVRAALAVFQARTGLPVSGLLDDATKKKLGEHHEEGNKKDAGAPHPKPKDAAKPKVVVPPRKPAPKAVEEPSLYDLARHQLTTFHDWVADYFQEPVHESKPNTTGLKKEASVTPSTKDHRSPNVLGSACACFVCTLKLIVVRQSHQDLTEIHEKIGGKFGPAPPAKAEDLLGWFRDEPFGMNIVGIRKRHSFTNLFDDTIVTFFRAGVDEGDDAWKKIADKHGVANQAWVLGNAKFVPCKRFGGWWAMIYSVSTDPGWEATKDGTDIGMSVLNVEDGTADNTATLRAGEAFLCPGWYKDTWRIGPHHKNARGGHLALRQDKPALIERLKHPTYNAKPTPAAWLRVYKDGKVTDHANVVIHVTHNPPPAVPAGKTPPTVIDLDKDDVIGIRYFDAVGINIHRGHGHPTQAGATTSSATVGFGKGADTAYSEGCQVFRYSEGFDPFLRQCMLAKWWRCRNKTAADGCARASKDQFVKLGFFETVKKEGKADYKQWSCYSDDRIGTCDDTGGTCDARYDYVLVELAGKDVDALRTDFTNLKSDYKFQNDNKLFLGGEIPGGGSNEPAGTPPANDPKTTPTTTTPQTTTPAEAGPNDLSASVGAGGVNRPADVGKVQQRLKAHGLYTGEVNNACDPATLAAIAAFQGAFLDHPDGLIEPGKSTWKKLLAEPTTTATTTPAQNETSTPSTSATTCGCKWPTSDPLYRAAKETVVSTNEMFESVTRVWKELVGAGKSAVLVEDCATVLVGQWGLETGWGKKMMNFNFGNVKRGGSTTSKYTAFATSEYYKTEAKALAAADCAVHARTLGKRSKGWGAWFEAPHLQTFFRAYDTLDEGVKAHFAILQKQANFKPAWDALVAHANGTGPAADTADRHDRLEEIGLEFGTKLYEGHYATAADYDEQMSKMATSVWMRVKKTEYAAWKAANTKTKLVVG